MEVAVVYQLHFPYYADGTRVAASVSHEGHIGGRGKPAGSRRLRDGDGRSEAVREYADTAARSRTVRSSDRKRRSGDSGGGISVLRITLILGVSARS